MEPNIFSLLFKGILYLVNKIFAASSYWLRKLWEWPVYLWSLTCLLVGYIGSWVSDHLWVWADGVLQDFLHDLGFHTPDVVSAHGLAGWFVDCFALDTLGRLILTAVAVAFGAKILYFAAFCIKQLTRIIP